MLRAGAKPSPITYAFAALLLIAAELAFPYIYSIVTSAISPVPVQPLNISSHSGFASGSSINASQTSNRTLIDTTTLQQQTFGLQSTTTVSQSSKSSTTASTTYQTTILLGGGPSIAPQSASTVPSTTTVLQYTSAAINFTALPGNIPTTSLASPLRWIS